VHRCSQKPTTTKIAIYVLYTYEILRGYWAARREGTRRFIVPLSFLFIGRIHDLLARQVDSRHMYQVRQKMRRFIFAITLSNLV